MTDKENQSDTAAQLRRQAEEKLRQEDPLVPESLLGLSPEEISQRLHELRVHQIELEMQNEELRRTQEELGDSRARYFDLYDLAPVGYVTLSETGLILETNLTAATLLCKARNELVKWPVSNFILTEDQDIYYRHQKQLFETGESQTCELRMVRPEEPPFWVRLDATAVQGKDGSLTCRVVIVDITERKETEKVLLQSEERLRLSLSGADLGMWDWKVVDGSVIFDERWAEMLGYRLDEIEPNVKAWQNLVHPDDMQNIMKTLNDHLEGRTKTYKTEHRLRHKSNKWIWVLDSGRVIEREAQGKALRVCGTHRDITERKKIEKELEKNYEILEEKVKERTSEIQEMNFALNVLLKKRDDDKKEMEEKIFTNYKSLTSPFLQKLKSSLTKRDQQNLLGIIETSLKEIIAPFSKKLSNPLMNLTPSEIQIAAMIKQGFSNKEIASQLNNSVRTITKHRDHIREKLNLKNKKINLQSYLSNL